MHSLLGALAVLRAPIVVAVIAYLVLLLPGQSEQIFITISEMTLWTRPGRLVATVFRVLPAAILLGAVFLICARRLIRAVPAYRLVAAKRHAELLDAISLVLAPVPITLLLVAYVRAVTEWPKSVGLIVPAAAFGAVAYLTSRNRARRHLTLVADRMCAMVGETSVGRVLMRVSIVIMTLNVLIASWPVQFGSLLGPIAVVFLFLAVLCVAASLLTHVYDRFQVPAIPALAVLALVAGTYGLNHNHELRVLSKEPPPAAPALADAFNKWLENRPDIDDFEGRPYPVYLVSAEGGGLYAAIHAAATLAAIQDNCPAFAAHVFAISAVSGGALGAAVFNSIVRAKPPPRNLPKDARCPPPQGDNNERQKLVREFFDRDFLTPVMAAGLFPDFFQHFLPWPIGAFDRSRALEASFETAWREVMRDNPNPVRNYFSSDFRSHWDAGADAPALLLNTTVVKSGGNILAAPFRVVSKWSDEGKMDVLLRTGTWSLAASVGLSARFPIVTPPAWVKPHGTASFEVMDGGYFDNSGMWTIIDLAQQLLEAAKTGTGDKLAAGSGQEVCAPGNLGVLEVRGRRQPFCVKLLKISAWADPSDRSVQGELAAPMTAFFSARVAHTHLAGIVAKRQYCGDAKCGLGQKSLQPHVYFRRLKLSRRLPLGWYYSRETVKGLIASTAPRAACSDTVAPDSHDEQLKEIEMENSCLFSRIAADLRL